MSFIISSTKPKTLEEVRILQNRPIAKNQWALTVKFEHTNLVDFLPGQFCMISLPDLVDPLGARPFALVEQKEDTAQFIYRVSGKFTQLLVKAPQGSRLNLLGPLGCGISRDYFKRSSSLFVAGGVGYASLLPLIAAVGEAGKTAKIFYGVREELEIIRRLPFTVDFASDDGSIGFKGRLPELLKQKKADWQNVDSIFVCGPTPMMKAVYEVLPPERTYYFVEETMGCGFGICMSCVIPTRDPNSHFKYSRSCIDGPVFQGSALTYWKERA